MKVAALSPYFVVEVPESVDQQEQERVASVLSFRKAPEVQSASASGLEQDSTPREAMQEETKEGLRRLASFLKKQKKDGEKKSNDVVQALQQELIKREKRRRAFQVYGQVMRDDDQMNSLGSMLDKFY